MRFDRPSSLHRSDRSERAQLRIGLIQRDSDRRAGTPAGASRRYTVLLISDIAVGSYEPSPSRFTSQRFFYATFIPRLQHCPFSLRRCTTVSTIARTAAENLVPQSQRAPAHEIVGSAWVSLRPPKTR